MWSQDDANAGQVEPPRGGHSSTWCCYSQEHSLLCLGLHPERRRPFVWEKRRPIPKCWRKCKVLQSGFLLSSWDFLGNQFQKFPQRIVFGRIRGSAPVFPQKPVLSSLLFFSQFLFLFVVLIIGGQLVDIIAPMSSLSDKNSSTYLQGQMHGEIPMRKSKLRAAVSRERFKMSGCAKDKWKLQNWKQNTQGVNSCSWILDLLSSLF